LADYLTNNYGQLSPNPKENIRMHLETRGMVILVEAAKHFLCNFDFEGPCFALDCEFDNTKVPSRIVEIGITGMANEDTLR